MTAGRPAEARPLLAELARAWPDSADVQRLAGLAALEVGDLVEAEDRLRRALSLNPRSGPAAVPLARLLIKAGRAPEALAVAEAVIAVGTADLHTLTVRADVLKSLGRLDDAVVAYGEAARADPSSAVADHNLAAALGDAEQFVAAEARARKALAKGLDAPQTWSVLARALRGQARHEEAEAAFVEAIRRAPFDPDHHGELAQSVWMRTGDVHAAVAGLDAALRVRPDAASLNLKKADLLEYAGDLAGAYDAARQAIAHAADTPEPHLAAARLATRLAPSEALTHAERALALRPDDPSILSGLCEVNLALGRADRAAAIAESLRRASPLDQHAIGYHATALRLMDHPGHRELYDYERLVRPWRIDVPDGWPNLAAYLADLKASLLKLHTLATHPVGQSLRQGSQTTQSLTRSDDPAIKAFFQAIDGPIRTHIAWLGAGDDVVRRRATGRYQFNGVWSVRLHPGGFHANHVHPMGWLSSAFYVALPSSVSAGGREGWLKFGEPGIATAPALDPEHYVQPEAGLLALFPSYMWHGTVPFSGDQPRLTIAFDVIPA